MGEAARTWGEKETEGCGGQREDKRGGGCKTKGEERGRLGLGGEMVGSHPSDRDQRPKSAITSVLPTPAYKSKKVLLFH
jgi:hypothetical protein